MNACYFLCMVKWHGSGKCILVLQMQTNLILALLLSLDCNMQLSAHLVSILDFCCGSVVGLLKEDLLHLAVL